MIVLKTDYIKLTYDFIEPPYKLGNADYDVDMFCLPLKDDGLIASDDELIFYNNFSNKNKSICLSVDCISGCVDCGTDSLLVNLSEVPVNEETLLVILHLYQAHERKISFTDGESKVSVRKMDHTMEHRCQFHSCGDTIISYYIDTNAESLDTIELCRLIRAGNDWGIVFPNNAKVEVSFTEYLRSFGVTV